MIKKGNKRSSPDKLRRYLALGKKRSLLQKQNAPRSPKKARDPKRIKRRRVLAIGFASFFVLLVLAVVFFPYEKTMRAVLGYIEERYGLGIAYEKITVDIKNGAYAENVEVRHRETSIAKAKRFSIALDFSRLYRLRLGVKRIVVSESDLNLKGFQDFYSALMRENASVTPPSEPSSPRASFFKIELNEFQFENANFVYGAYALTGDILLKGKDIDATIATKYGDLEFSMKNFKEGAIVLHRVQWAEIIPDLPLLRTLGVNAYIPDIQRDRIALRFTFENNVIHAVTDRQITLADRNGIRTTIGLALTFNVDTMIARIRTPESLFLNARYVANATYDVGKGTLTVTFDIKDYFALAYAPLGLKGEAKGNGAFNLKKGLSATIDLRNVIAALPYIKKPITLEAGRVALVNNVIRPVTLSARYANEPLAIVVKENTITKSAWAFGVAASVFDFDDIVIKRANAAKPPSLPVGKKARAPKNEMSFTFDTTLREFKWKNVSVETVSGIVRVTPEEVAVRNLAGEFALGKFEGSYRLMFKERPFRQSVRLKAENVSIATALRSLTGKPHAFGTASIEANGDLQFRTFEDLLKLSAFDYAIAITNGSVLQNKYILAIYEKIGRAKDAPEAEYFNAITVTGNFQNGAFIIDTFLLDGEDIYYRLENGSFNPSTMTYRIAGTALFSEEFRSRIIPNVLYGAFPPSPLRPGWYQLPSFVINESGELVFQSK